MYTHSRYDRAGDECVPQVAHLEQLFFFIRHRSLNSNPGNQGTPTGIYLKVYMQVQSQFPSVI